MIPLCWSQQIKQVTTLSLFVKNELGFTSTFGKLSYARTNLTSDEILQNHISVLNAFKIPKTQRSAVEKIVIFFLQFLGLFLSLLLNIFFKD
jgi:hypothetical protein